MDRIKLQPTARQLIYDNILMVDPDGTPMCRLSARKARFYLRNELADELPGETPVIRLRFEPQGPGQADNEYMLAARESRCVVCGRTDDLTRHHVVPYCYRRYLPRQYTVRSSNYDVLVMCVEHHLQYEAAADHLKVEIAKELGVHTHGNCERLWNDDQRLHARASSAANALVRYRSMMPPERVQYHVERIAEFLGHVPTDEEICAVAGHRANAGAAPPHGQQVVERITDVHEFVVRWRQHFLETTKPAFLDPTWDPHRRFET